MDINFLDLDVLHNSRSTEKDLTEVEKDVTGEFSKSNFRNVNAYSVLRLSRRNLCYMHLVMRL